MDTLFNTTDNISKYVNEDGELIMYLATSSGVDGRDKQRIEFASVSKADRDNWIANKGTNAGYYSKTSSIVNYEYSRKQALAKLDGLQKVLLDIEPPKTLTVAQTLTRDK